MIRNLMFCLALLAGSASAQSAAVEARLTQGFDRWLSEVGDPDAVLLAVGPEGTGFVLERGWQPDRAIDLASLSKSVTALCVAVVVAEGALAVNSTSAEVLGYGVDGVTVAQLLTHASGLRPDQTQALMYLWLDRDVDAADLASRRALGRDIAPEDRGRYHYNNENYAVLGQMIAAVTGQSYAQACAARVLAPAGAGQAVPSPRTGATLPWGGWHMSVADYARVLEWGYAPQRPGVQAGVRAPLGRGASYGWGMIYRATSKGRTSWHHGSWCYPLRHNTGAFAIYHRSGWRVVLAYAGCVPRGGLRQLTVTVREALEL